MRPLVIGLCQDAGLLDSGEFRSRLRGVDLVVFPELVDGGYAALSRGEGIHDPDDRFVGRFRRLTSERKLSVVAGSVCLRSAGGAMTNTSLLFRKKRLVHRYDKIHLFRPCRDHDYFRPGETIGTCVLPIAGRRVRTGIIICYDLRFPELVRAMALGGLHLLVVPARWPAARDMAWQTLLRARAIENQMFVVGHNARGEEGGHSYVFDPFGEMLYSSLREPEAPLAEVMLDLDRIRAAHLLHRNLRDARVLREASIPSRLNPGRPRERRRGPGG